MPADLLFLLNDYRADLHKSVEIGAAAIGLDVDTCYMQISVAPGIRRGGE